MYDNKEEQSNLLCKPNTGNSLKYIEAHIQQFWNERKYDKILKNMEIDQYVDKKGLQNAHIKLLIMKCKKKPYKNKKITIRIVFNDQYPSIPPKMYVVPHNNVHFIHANVYEDNGEVCHPALQKKEYQTFNYKLSDIFKKIYQLIYKPNFKNPANIVLGNIFKVDREEYEQIIKENAQSLENNEQSQSQSEDSNEQSKK